MHSFELGILSLAFPLLGFVVSYWLDFSKRRNGITICLISVLGSFISSIIFLFKVVIYQESISIHFFNWIKADSIKATFGMLIDPLSASMMVIVSFISLLVHIYSVAYMAEERKKLLFFSYLNLFTFMMLLLVSSPNMLQMFCGWEGVGLASYLLIGFWYEKKTATKSAIKAFVVNRIGDVGFVLAMGAIFLCFQTFDFSVLFSKISSKINIPNQHEIDIIAILLFIGAMGKSGQFGLHTWLPDAMEAPTPVSALLHAATMVTAGVFLIIRFSPVVELSVNAKNLIMVIGALTGILAGSIAMVQNDIKKIIAYSTCSQLGLMFMACAAGAYSFAFFHLFTHAFFKALLFLGAGAVIHAMSHEQNIKFMGGLKNYLPFSYYSMIIGTLALTGIPFFAGYYSKDLIFEAVYQSSFVAYLVCLIITFLTGIYSWRLIFVVFLGNNRSDDQVISHIHKVGNSMNFSIAILSFCSMLMGFVGYKFFIEQSFDFNWQNSLVSCLKPEVSHIVSSAPLIVSVVAFAITYYIYVVNNNAANILMNRFLKTYSFLKNKWFFDVLYEKFFEKTVVFGRFLYSFCDRNIIDKFGPDGVANVALKIGNFVQKTQSGYINNYILLAVLGVVFLLAFYIFLQLNPEFSDHLRIIMGQI